MGGGTQGRPLESASTTVGHSDKGTPWNAQTDAGSDVLYKSTSSEERTCNKQERWSRLGGEVAREEQTERRSTET